MLYKEKAECVDIFVPSVLPCDLSTHVPTMVKPEAELMGVSNSEMFSLQNCDLDKPLFFIKNSALGIFVIVAESVSICKYSSITALIGSI